MTWAPRAAAAAMRGARTSGVGFVLSTTTERPAVEGARELAQEARRLVPRVREQVHAHVGVGGGEALPVERGLPAP